MAVVARWWNGRFGRMARRDVRLVEQAGCWTVEIVEGGTEGRSPERWAGLRRELELPAAGAA